MDIAIFFKQRVCKILLDMWIHLFRIRKHNGQCNWFTSTHNHKFACSYQSLILSEMYLTICPVYLNFAHTFDFILFFFRFVDIWDQVWWHWLVGRRLCRLWWERRVPSDDIKSSFNFWGAEVEFYSTKCFSYSGK